MGVQKRLAGVEESRETEGLIEGWSEREKLMERWGFEADKRNKSAEESGEVGGVTERMRERI